MIAAGIAAAVAFLPSDPSGPCLPSDPSAAEEDLLYPYFAAVAAVDPNVVVVAAAVDKAVVAVAVVADTVTFPSAPPAIVAVAAVAEIIAAVELPVQPQALQQKPGQRLMWREW